MRFDWELLFVVIALVTIWLIIFVNMGCTSFKRPVHHSCPLPTHGDCPICGKVDNGR